MQPCMHCIARNSPLALSLRHGRSSDDAEDHMSMFFAAKIQSTGKFRQSDTMQVYRVNGGSLTQQRNFTIPKLAHAGPYSMFKQAAESDVGKIVLNVMFNCPVCAAQVMCPPLIRRSSSKPYKYPVHPQNRAPWGGGYCHEYRSNYNNISFQTVGARSMGASPPQTSITYWLPHTFTIF